MSMNLAADTTQAERMGFDYLKIKLQDLMTVRCAYCGGWGHTDRDCQTGTKLKKISAADNYFSHFIRTAKEKAYNLVSGPGGILGKQPRPQDDPDDMIMFGAMRAEH